ncbi:MAG: hypothetical protein U0270_04915 [Labilithrix sp.]
MKTLIGNGWLRESPKNLWPRGWDIKSRSALRKCVFLPVPPEAAEFLRNLPPPKPFVAVPLAPAAARPATPPVRRNDPNRNARAFEAVSPEQIAAEQRKRLLVDARRTAMGKKPLRPANDTEPADLGPRAWYEDPMAIGTLLILLPPLGLAAIWSSKRYSNDARWALTVMTGLTMFLVAAVVIALSLLQLR